MLIEMRKFLDELPGAPRRLRAADDSGAPRLSLRLLEDLHRRKVRAVQAIESVYRAKRGPFGPLGAPTGQLKVLQHGFVQPTSMGSYILADPEGSAARAFGPIYRASVYLSGFTCFGTDDRTEDEVQIVVVVSDPNGEAASITRVFGGDDGYNASGGRSVSINEIVVKDLPFGPQGLNVYVAVVDLELGSTAAIEAKVRKIFDGISDAVKVAAVQKITGMATSLLDAAAPAIGANEGVDWLWDTASEWIADGLVSLAEKVFGPDLVGQHVHHVTSGRLVDEIFADYPGSLHMSECGERANVGVPPNDPLLENGEGSYKVYLKVKVTQTTPEPMDP